MTMGQMLTKAQFAELQAGSPDSTSLDDAVDALTRALRQRVETTPAMVIHLWPMTADGVPLAALSTKQTATALDLSTTTVDELIKNGDLAVVDLGRRRLIPWYSILALLARHERVRGRRRLQRRAS